MVVSFQNHLSYSFAFLRFQAYAIWMRCENDANAELEMMEMEVYYMIPRLMLISVDC
jgi:hypothetical protein